MMTQPALALNGRRPAVCWHSSRPTRSLIYVEAAFGSLIIGVGPRPSTTGPVLKRRGVPPAPRHGKAVCVAIRDRETRGSHSFRRDARRRRALALCSQAHAGQNPATASAICWLGCGRPLIGGAIIRNLAGAPGGLGRSFAPK